MKKILLAAAAIAALAIHTAPAMAYDYEANLPNGEKELADILTPEQIEADLNDSGDLGLDIDAMPTGNGSKLVISVDKKTQRLTLTRDGQVIDSWLVSTGKGRMVTPSGTYGVTRMHYTYTSRKYNARMDRAIFFHGGYALHQTYGANVPLLGTPQSHGCVRQSPENGDKLFRIVQAAGAKNVTIIIK
jgi:lipoprotein-anchoring transpeptidase ErfK/SrfK